MVDTVGRGGAGGRVSVPSLGGRRPPAKRKRPQKERRKKPRPDKTAKPESSMKSKKKATFTNAQIDRLTTKIRRRDAKEREVIDNTNATMSEYMGSVKGGIRRDLHEFRVKLKAADKAVNKNVRQLKNLKNLKTERKQAEKRGVKKKSTKYEVDQADLKHRIKKRQNKGTAQMIRHELLDPNRHRTSAFNPKAKPPPKKSFANKEGRGFKKEVSEKFKKAIKTDKEITERIRLARKRVKAAKRKKPEVEKKHTPKKRKRVFQE